MLTVSLPFLLLAAAAIKLDSPGPVFSRDACLGPDGRSFHRILFRTAPAGAGQPGRLGQALRRLRLDEVPQVLNVLLRSMSPAGPRPGPGPCAQGGVPRRVRR